MFRRLKNKGFTLTEIVVTLVILGIIIAIAIPSYNSLIKKFEKNYYDEMKGTVYQATKTYFKDNNESLPSGLLEVSVVDFKDLVSEKYVDNDLKEYKSKNKCTGYGITIKTNDGYKNAICGKCGNTSITKEDDTKYHLCDAKGWTATSDGKYVSNNSGISYDLPEYTSVYYNETTIKADIRKALAVSPIVKKTITYNNETENLIEEDTSVEQVYPEDITGVSLSKMNEKQTLKYKYQGKIKTIDLSIYRHSAPDVETKLNVDESSKVKVNKDGKLIIKFINPLSYNKEKYSKIELYRNDETTCLDKIELNNGSLNDLGSKVFQITPISSKETYYFVATYADNDNNQKIEKSDSITVDIYAKLTYSSSNDFKINQFNSKWGELLDEDNTKWFDDDEKQVTSNTLATKETNVHSKNASYIVKIFNERKSKDEPKILTVDYYEEANIGNAFSISGYMKDYAEISYEYDISDITIDGDKNPTGNLTDSVELEFKGWKLKNLNEDISKLFLESKPVDLNKINKSTKMFFDSFVNLQIPDEVAILTSTWGYGKTDLKTIEKYGYDCMWKKSTLNYRSGAKDVQVTDDITLSAYCTKKTIDINYYDDDGSKYTTISTKKEYGKPIQIANAPSKDGNIFKGWTTIKNGKEPLEKYAPGKDYSDDYTLNLYAVWEKWNSTLCIKPNNGIVKITDINGEIYNTEDLKTPISGSITLNNNKEFCYLGTYDSSFKVSQGNKTNISYKPLYANFYEDDNYISLIGSKSAESSKTSTYEKESLSIDPQNSNNFKNDIYTFKNNGGKETINAKFSFSDGSYSSVTITCPTASRTGYTFDGWFIYGNSNAKCYGNDSLTITKNTSLYGGWTKKEYTITYNKNASDSVSNMPSSQTKEYGIDAYLSSNVPIREGYIFNGWKDDSNIKYNPGESYTIDENLNLTAIWDKEIYTITYNKNAPDSVSNMPSSQKKDYGDYIYLSSNTPTRFGYNFLGWSKVSSSSTAEFSRGSKYSDNKSITLYAIWKPTGKPSVYIQANDSSYDLINSGSLINHSFYVRVYLKNEYDSTINKVEAKDNLVNTTYKSLSQESNLPTGGNIKSKYSGYTSYYFDTYGGVNGKYTFNVKVTYDTNETVENTYSITLDTVAPSIPSLTYTQYKNGTYSNYSVGNWTNADFVDRYISSKDDLSGIKEFQYIVSSQGASSCSGTGTTESYSYYSTNTYKISYSPSSSNYACFRAIDKAGNASAWTSVQKILIDRTAPSVTIRYVKQGTSMPGDDTFYSNYNNNVGTIVNNGSQINVSESIMLYTKVSDSESGVNTSINFCSVSGAEANRNSAGFRNFRNFIRNGTTTVKCEVKDNAGNSSGVYNITINNSHTHVYGNTISSSTTYNNKTYSFKNYIISDYYSFGYDNASASKKEWNEYSDGHTHTHYYMAGKYGAWIACYVCGESKYSITKSTESMWWCPKDANNKITTEEKNKYGEIYG